MAVTATLSIEETQLSPQSSLVGTETEGDDKDDDKGDESEEERFIARILQEIE